MGKSGKGYGGGGEKGKGAGDKGKGFGKDWKGEQTGKGLGAGKGERPVGACSHWWGFGHYYRACPIRLGPEAAAQAEKEYLAKGRGKDWK